jgi:hypothetical protein
MNEMAHKFMKPFAVTLAASLATVPATASTTVDITSSLNQTTAASIIGNTDFVIERPAVETGGSSRIQMAGHSSHVSHASHASHASHCSGFSYC